MQRLSVTLILFALSTGPVFATGHHHHHHHHHHGTHAHHHADSGFAAGQPGTLDKAQRTLTIRALDAMRFEPADLDVKRGETVRLVFTNAGQLPHEAVIGNHREQQAHEEEMVAMADSMTPMEHHHANAASLPPGATRELVWRFSKSGQFEIGCHLPGHYQAGMVAKITVR